MDAGARGRGAKDRGKAVARGGRAIAHGGRADSRGGRGWGHGLLAESGFGAGDGARVGVAPGAGAAPAQGRDDLVVRLLKQLLARLPPTVPQQASGVPPVAWVHQGAAVAEQPRAIVVDVPLYLEMMGQM
ncbi:unnamed protein product [Microthlaspi erraticum]|uniref:Uncharacterized protein n=1 Tax=Microthlaspi erraticum TaxID=1685480 RepID=A0A6D2KLC1_9BRAS|nr:unnamed protein product [Microthlaspi erraticum]